MTAHSRDQDFSPARGRNRKRALATQAPLLARQDHGHPSVFLPENLLSEARKQKNLADAPVPEICLLDPDGDISGFVQRERGAFKCPSWACFHTELWEWNEGGLRFGIVGCAVGAPFAVLIAEQLFVSGCELVISVTSAGAIAEGLPKPSYMLIEKALRDEGTSYHYLPPAPYAAAEPVLFAAALNAALAAGLPVISGISWTTDAPYRETAVTIAARQAQGIHAVEMEAAALLSFAEAKKKPVIAIAHITNAMAQEPGDFDKGQDHGAETALAIASAIASNLPSSDGGRDAGTRTRI